ncbi:MAG: hypothetical protein QM711_02390 [Micropruina sp.]|uniref:hypothetical protein n=1 Tax=Micropruina sp. TaxID=2737536 RepID=UPI0039E6D7A1
MVREAYMGELVRATTDEFEKRVVWVDQRMMAGYHAWVADGPRRRNILWYRNDSSDWVVPIMETSDYSKSIRVRGAGGRPIRLDYEVDRHILQSSAATSSLRISGSRLRWMLEGGGEQVYVMDDIQLRKVVEFGIPFIVSTFLARLV